MQKKELIQILEEYAPLEFAESWDNPGLLVGTEQGEVRRLLIALDLTDAVVRQAIDGEFDMIVTHHPMIFRGIQSVTEDTREGRRILKLISHGITYFAMHTNCDTARMAQRAADLLGLNDTSVLAPLPQDTTSGIGRVGNLPSDMSLSELARKVKESFQISYVLAAAQLSDEPCHNLDKKVRRVAISPGSGHDFVDQAKQLGAEVLITGDIGHHVLLDANADGLAIIDAGHFGTEHFMKKQLLEYIVNEKGLPISVSLAVETEPCVII